jgi:hypothetical protein
MLELHDGTRKNWQASTIHTNMHKTNTRWSVHSWSTFGARMSHGKLKLTSHHLPLYSILCAPPRGSHPNDILSKDSQVGVLKLPNLGLSQFWGPISSHEDLGLRWGLKQSCGPHQELSKTMFHATCTQLNRVDSKLLMVGTQIANLTPDPSFGHNLCFKCSNGSWEPILNI